MITTTFLLIWKLLLPLLVLGIGLGWVRWSSGRLGSCVLMHGLWNALTFANLVVLGW